jgi:hypothetical protein
VSVVVPLIVDAAYLGGDGLGTPAFGLRTGPGIEWTPYDERTPIPTWSLRAQALAGPYACTASGSGAAVPWCGRFVGGGSLHIGYLVTGGITVDGGAALELTAEVGALTAPESGAADATALLGVGWQLF